MLSTYSWSEFIVFLLVLGFSYYLYVILRYYRKDLTEFVSSKSHTDKTDADNLPVQTDESVANYIMHSSEDQVPMNEVTNGLSDIEQLMAKVKSVVTRAVEEGWAKPQLIGELGRTMNQYPEVNEPILRSSINEFIQKICKEKGAAILDEEEIDVLWDD